MLKLFLLIQRFWGLILFLILEGISIYFIAKTHSVQGIGIINSTNSVVGYVYQKQTNVTEYFRLRKVNEQLLEENKSLHNEIAHHTTIDSFEGMAGQIPTYDFTNENLSDPTNDSTNVDTIPVTPGMKLLRRPPLAVIRYAEYNFIPARVINNSVSNDKINFITLSRGAKSGIKRGDPVVTYNGIVGRVEKVSENFSIVASVLSDRKVSARLRQKEAVRPIQWKPGHPAYVEMPNAEPSWDIRLKDSVFTSGYSSYPGNILIGTVVGIDSIKKDNSLTLKIKLSTDFRNLDFVYVIGDAMGEEKEKLSEEANSKNSN